MKKLAALVCGTALVAGGMVVATPASPAGAATVKACVNKKSGDIRFLTGTKKRKCKKGWKKITWNQQGAQGPQGPQGNTGATGPKMVAKDGSGNVIGPLASVYPIGGAYFSILVNGGVYLYEPSGRVVPVITPVYKQADCSGTPYVDTTSAETRDIYVAGVGSSARFTYRATTPTWGATSAYAMSGSSESNVAPAPAIALYERDSSGTCVLESAAFNGYLITLTPQASPPADVTGPITIVES